MNANTMTMGQLQMGTGSTPYKFEVINGVVKMSVDGIYGAIAKMGRKK